MVLHGGRWLCNSYDEVWPFVFFFKSRVICSNMWHKQPQQKHFISRWTSLLPPVSTSVFFSPLILSVPSVCTSQDVRPFCHSEPLPRGYKCTVSSAEHIQEASCRTYIGDAAVHYGLTVSAADVVVHQRLPHLEATRGACTRHVWSKNTRRADGPR